MHICCLFCDVTNSLLIQVMVRRLSRCNDRINIQFTLIVYIISHQLKFYLTCFTSNLEKMIKMLPAYNTCKLFILYNNFYV